MERGLKLRATRSLEPWPKSAMSPRRRRDHFAIAEGWGASQICGMPMSPRAVVALASLFCVLPLARLAAQDVSVGEPVWYLPEPAPEVMPKPKSRVRPDYPDEMRQTSEMGYVIIVRYIDLTGKSLGLDATGTHVPFQRSVEATFGNWSVSAAKRGGQPVNALVWLSVIFNPKSAAANGPDATPRLLAVAPVETPIRPTPEGQPPVVSMKLNLDAAGAIVAAEPVGMVKPPVLAAIRGSLQKWRFAPARRGGQPIAAELVMPVLCQQPTKWDAGKQIPPKVISQEHPVYPYAMARFGLRGKVVIDFVVDDQGRVKGPVIAESDNPEFDEPALKALRRWKFQPATLDGQPVNTRTRVPIVFELNQTVDGGDPFFQLEKRGDQAKLPPELRYDTPPKIRGVLVPVYPYELRRGDVSGKARVTIAINRRGRVGAVKILEADRPEFGRALVAALEGFTFDPALKDGKPVQHLVNFEQVFGSIELPDESGDDLLRLEKKHPERIVAASALDAPLKPVSQRAAVFPVSVGADVATGEAVIEVLIDEDGHARLPRIVSATDEAFGYAAMQAAAAWWFEPPMAGGKPAVVRARVPFKFGTKSPAPAKGGEK
jgi:TonB family protein